MVKFDAVNIEKGAIEKGRFINSNYLGAGFLIILLRSCGVSKVLRSHCSEVRISKGTDREKFRSQADEEHWRDLNHGDDIVEYSMSKPKTVIHTLVNQMVRDRIYVSVS